MLTLRHPHNPLIICSSHPCSSHLAPLTDSPNRCSSNLIATGYRSLKSNLLSEVIPHPLLAAIGHRLTLAATRRPPDNRPPITGPRSNSY